MFDFAIIGSGVSGGRIAYELVAAGASCVLIEAGREFSQSTFPDNEMDYSTQMFWGGGLEISDDGHLGFLRARCLGGTSIVNQALLDRFDDLAWDDWRSRSGVSFLCRDGMEPHYSACERGLKVGAIPERYYNRNARIFVKALDAMKRGWEPLRRAQSDCKLDQGSDCIVCLGGCPRDSKQSSLVTTIRWAREKGLKVESDFEVHHIAHSPDQVRVVGKSRGTPAEVAASRCVLAAGALGNTAILLNSEMGKRLPALGTAFCCHPQYMTYAAFDEPVDAHKGAFQAVKSEDEGIRRAGYKLENVFAPPIGTAMLMPGYGDSHLRLMKKYRYLASMEVAIRDEPAGRIRMGAGGKLRIEKPLTDADREKSRGGLKLVRELFEAAGAKDVIQCTQGFGLHLMGGCPIGADPARSVVDPEFRVHGCSNVFAADSSVFPAAPGINPSFTVMALAHRAAETMARR